jgi:hypothetical protein
MRHISELSAEYQRNIRTSEHQTNIRGTSEEHQRIRPLAHEHQRRIGKLSVVLTYCSAGLHSGPVHCRALGTYAEVIHECHALDELLHFLMVDLTQVSMSTEIFVSGGEVINAEVLIVGISEDKQDP